MKCCATCFGDRGLRKSIIPSLTTEMGTCGYCRTEATLIVDPEKLAGVFGTLIGIYELHEQGSPLVRLLKDDCGMFDHDRMDDARSQVLLGDILDDGEIVRKNFRPSPLYQTDGLRRWEQLREELMFGNRYFPTVGIDEKRLEVLLSSLIQDPDDLPVEWFRARLLTRDEPYSANEMEAPPKQQASHGRANPAGIPYLYLGSRPDTAIAEVRPHTGEKACIARFATPADLKIIDLRNPMKSVSPFLQGDEVQIGYMRADIPFLARLGNELTRPVVPMSAAVDYVPSQYLCEFIKKCGYDGVVYRSSVSDGMNMALFNPARAVIGDITIRSVSRVWVDID